MSGVIEFNVEAARRIEAAYLTADVVAQRLAVHDALEFACEQARARPDVEYSFARANVEGIVDG